MTLANPKHGEGNAVAQDLRERKRVFDLISSRMRCRRPLDLVLAHKIDSRLHDRVKESAKIFLSRVLKSKHVIEDEQELVERFMHSREQVECVTPTGIVIPKYYSSLEYNLLMRDFYQAVDALGFGDLIDSWQIPMHIRIKYPKARIADLERPRHAPEEAHIDSWSGYSSRGITFLMPLFGDVENNTVGFYESEQTMREKWLAPVNSPMEKQHIQSHHVKKATQTNRGDVLMWDASVLHATDRKEQCGLRISIDNIFVPRMSRAEQTLEIIDPERKEEQLKHSELVKLCKKKIFVFPDHDGQIRDTNAGRKDPAHFKVISFNTGENPTVCFNSMSGEDDWVEGEQDASPLLIEQRNALLRDITENLEVKQDFPIIKEAQLPEGKYAALQDAVGEYIRASLFYGGVSVSCMDNEELVAKHKNDILALSNVTPNGLIRPKLETNLEYNVFHRRLADLMAELNIDEHLLKMRLPVTIRIVDGIDSANVDGRPRANAKMHSDFWTAGCMDLALLCPIFGDIERTTVRFAEPYGLSADFLSEQPSYQAGEALYSHYKQYDMNMRKGFLYFQDIYCLHATWRQGGGARVSLDWTAQCLNYPALKELYASHVLEHDNHQEVHDWYRIGRSLLYADTESVEDCKRRFSGERLDAMFVGAGLAAQTSTTARFFNLDGSANRLELARLPAAKDSQKKVG